MRAKEIKQTNNEALDIKMPKKIFNNVKKLRAQCLVPLEGYGLILQALATLLATHSP